MKKAEEKHSRFRSSLIFPVLLDVQVPLPGKVVVLIIVSEFGLYVVGATGQHSFGGFLQRGEKLVLGRPWPVAPHHVVRFIN